MAMMLTRRNRYGYNLFDELFRDPFFQTGITQRDSSLMKTDIRETDDQYQLDVELPGFAKEDVHADLKDGYLTISAERNENNDEKDENGKYIKRERFSGTCKRSFYVGEDMQQEDIHASFKDGILTVEMPKDVPEKEEEVPTNIPIE